MLEAFLTYDAGGYYLHVCDEESDMHGRWYGTREECMAVNPETVPLFPMRPDPGIDPFDLACERRCD